MISPAKIKNRNILFRADLDFSLNDPSSLTTNYRFQSLLPTLKLCLQHASKTLIIGHQGRPTRKDTKYSLLNLKKPLETALHQSISFIETPKGVGDWRKSDSHFGLLENLRFFSGERNSYLHFAQQLSQGSDIYIYEAFAHFRPSASIQKIPKILPTLTGPHFDREVDQLSRIFHHPQKPTLLILSGTKKDKLDLLPSLASTFDHILIGGLLAKLASPTPKIIPATLTPDGHDINSSSLKLFLKHINQAQTIVLNGPLGLYEQGYSEATQTIFSALKKSSAFTLLGGGDTLTALTSLSFTPQDFNFVSTGGGSMLNFLSTHTHPLFDTITP